MNGLSFWRGVGWAAALSVVGAVAFAGLGPWLGGSLVMRALAVLLTGAYLLVLLHSSPVRRGRVLAVLVWAALAAVLAVLDASLASVLLVQTLSIWLVRSCFHHRKLWGAGLDLGLSLFALVAGIAATLHAGSILLGLWSFFLVQALWPVLPPLPGKRTAPNRGDRFEQAYRSAEAALRRLAQ